MLTHAGIHGWITRLPRGKTIDIAVIHAEGGGNEDGIVDLKISCAL
jgi:hypothetical protein